MQIRPYLIFKGECQEAIELYKRAFQTDVFRNYEIFGHAPKSGQHDANP